jgi:hypothetical protein
MLEEISPDRMWITKSPLRFYGVEMGTRMSVCRLSDGDLWVHSPLKLDRELRAALDSLGQVRHVVSPNKLHHLFMDYYAVAYPYARIYASPGLARKRPDLPFHATLQDRPEPEWGRYLDQMIFRGNAFMEEVIFLHRQSRTLILADLLESAHPDSPPLMRLFGRLFGIYEKPGPPLDMKLLFRDRAAARASLERVLSWDFDRISLAHGHLIETDGKRILREAYSFIR